MKLQLLTAVVLLASASTAAPTPSLIGSIISSILTTITSDLNSLLSAIGITLATNGSKHGPVNCTLTFPAVSVSNTRYSHSITWPTQTAGKYLNWTTFKANGANLGAWLEQEESLDTAWWDSVAPSSSAIDEWTLCEQLGSKCGPTLEARYASFITTATIDKFASVGVNTLRIPTTYAAWVKVPGSQLYTGDQQAYLLKISKYAIQKYGMHVIVGLHSLPGGVNSLNIGEAYGHDAWFFNTTNLAYSFQAIDAILSFITASGVPYGYTIAPINEASDNFAGFATATGLTTNGTNWINTYINGVLAKVAKVDKRIPVALQDCFLGESYWSPFYASGTNLVIDSHVYYFAASGIYSQYVAPAICGQASTLGGDGKFPVVVGEWSLQTLYNNTYSGRKTIFDTQRYAWQKYVAGGIFWNGRMYGNASVDGEGTQEDYWNYDGLIDAGVITLSTNASYC